MRHILFSRIKWMGGRHDGTAASIRGVDVRAPTLITQLLPGVATFLGVVASVESDPLQPTNVVGSIQAKVDRGWCVVENAMQKGQSWMEGELEATDELEDGSKA